MGLKYLLQVESKKKKKYIYMLLEANNYFSCHSIIFIAAVFTACRIKTGIRQPLMGNGVPGPRYGERTPSQRGRFALFYYYDLLTELIMADSL